MSEKSVKVVKLSDSTIVFVWGRLFGSVGGGSGCGRLECGLEIRVEEFFGWRNRRR